MLVQLRYLNPNQTKGGYKAPEAFSNAYHFVYDEIWIINPSCKFLFWCKKLFQIKIWGYWKRNFEKFAFEIFFLWKSKQKILKLFFFKKFSHSIGLFNDKYKFRMILAFIWYAYCPCRCKIVSNFSKIDMPKTQNFLC